MAPAEFASSAAVGPGFRRARFIKFYKAFAQMSYAELNPLRMNEGARIAAAEHERAEIVGELRQLVGAISDGDTAKTLMAKVHRLETRQSELEVQIAAYDAMPQAPDPSSAT